MNTQEAAEQVRKVLGLHADMGSHCHGDESVEDMAARQNRLYIAMYESIPALRVLLAAVEGQQIDQGPRKENGAVSVQRVEVHKMSDGTFITLTPSGYGENIEGEVEPSAEWLKWLFERELEDIVADHEARHTGSGKS